MPIITGKALAEKILQRITEDPESHNQNTWTADSDSAECGTQACIAGWAVAFNRHDGENEHLALSRLARELDTKVWYDYVGRELLGLSRRAANDLFYASDNRQARRMLAEHFDLPDPE